jgi:hypothetical protein
MKFKTFSSLMFLLAFILVSCEYERQLTQSTSDVETHELSKKPVKGELITFSGDLSGSQEVVGCCSNAGPFPNYTMTLSSVFPAHGTYEGQIFMNALIEGKGKNRTKSYIVQFWTGTMFLEVRGGEIEEDTINKITKVTFTKEPCTYETDDETTTVNVDFILTREQL